MPLKDLVIDIDSHSEELIEAIVRGYAGYDLNHRAVHLLPLSSRLGNRGKILLYLVAICGWPFVLPEETPYTDAPPSEIESRTGIPGGSLRPQLRLLTAERLIIQKNGRYGIPASNLPLIKEQLHKSDPLNLPDHSDEASDEPEKKTKRSIKKPQTGPASGISTLIASGWFTEGRTLGETQKELATRAIIVPINNLPQYFLRLIRGGQFTRKKEMRNGNSVWVYRSATAPQENF